MADNNPLADMIQAACEAALKNVMRISDVSPRRLMNVAEAAVYLSLSEREIYNMLESGELPVVCRGRRRMVDIKDADTWIASHKKHAA